MKIYYILYTCNDHLHHTQRYLKPRWIVSHCPRSGSQREHLEPLNPLEPLVESRAELSPSPPLDMTINLRTGTTVQRIE